tara:strand:+ start:1493 stop:1783 length:291 start_codon:yes stop_codon:yes gene_type:complete
MQNVTGSIDNQELRPLTPFEQAEYNLLQFANNAAFGQKFNDVIERLQHLELLQDIEEKVVEDKKDKDFQKNIKDEIKSIELVLDLLFDLHESLPEA